MSKIFIIVSVVVPLVLYFVFPLVLARFAQRAVSRTPLAIACVLFFVSWYLPSPDIEGRYTAFTTHAVGGGVFTGFLWLYVRQFFSRKFQPLTELAILYFFVSGLGVANELFEFAVVTFGFARLDPSDTWWDLVANTIGVSVFWIGTLFWKRIK
ncbi:hypothetical protein HY620_00755 [Candidatus Uhrbacteria bacterium]|nr:hypothetical protein [Candidatus Uhrbacteria bacterium]